ncbi:hepatic lectin-like [Penaeus chinensis]|uniref:hepatic lectin-like n=1 Tax=Penaeus chinensis TaxID=139456 RepID=UPI001FB69A21|nr:hepatic lectin-like [Penaeus chinensis]
MTCSSAKDPVSYVGRETGRRSSILQTNGDPQRSLKMQRSIAVLWLLAGMAVTGSELMQDTVEDLMNEHFPPLHTSNCSQSLTDLLLLRQEVKLDEMVKLLTDIRDLKAKSTSSVSRSCPADFEDFEGICLHMGTQVMTWLSARTYCLKLGGTLVTGLQNALIGRSFVQKSSPPDHVWIGGHDLFEKGKWEWLSGEAMPTDSSFWGSYLGVQQPNDGGSGEDCVGLYGQDDFDFHDFPCSWACTPLCQVVISA